MAAAYSFSCLPRFFAGLCCDGLSRQQTLSLSLTEKVHPIRPSGNVLFESVASCFGAGAITVILTGGDGDGATGFRAVKDAWGLTIAQDEASSELFSMLRAAIALILLSLVGGVKSSPSGLSPPRAATLPC